MPRELETQQIEAVLSRERDGSGNGKRGEPTTWTDVGPGMLNSRDYTHSSRPVVGEPTTIGMSDSPPTGERDHDSLRVIRQAADLVFGDRAANYGHPRDNFRRTAELLTGLLRDKLQPDASITTRDVALIMLLVKVARELHVPSFENRVDMVGYVLTSERLEE